MKIRKGDTVKVLQGKDKGKKGKVLQVFPKSERLVVEGVNKMVKHLRPKKEREGGQKVEFDGPFAASNVALICPKCSKQSRVGFKIMENKKKVRKCKKCNEII